ncbi:endogenous retrovirus group K member 113 Gag polyprotein-like [Cavia porcellus]|uniref:endogenous retrovirus group K member 113 Gag polyprotein-like n=1 Tax=Cavia porcellus TaxID=10141 RepID=UPI002FDF5723
MHGPPFSAQSRPLSYAPPPAGRYFYRRLWQGGRLFHEVHPPPGMDSDPYEIFPVQVAMGQGRNVREPFEIKQIRELKNAVTTFGPTAPYTIAMLENLSSGPLTPADWIQLAKACLPSGGYLDWRAWYAESSAEQAERNANRGDRGWNKRMLVGEGRRADCQTRFPGALWRGGDREPSAPPWSSFLKAAPRREAATGNPPFPQPAQEVTPRFTLSRPQSYDVAPLGRRYFHGRLLCRAG